MSLKVLFIGGSGEISASCVDAAVNAGHRVTLFNRGNHLQLNEAVHQVVGDIKDDVGYGQLAQGNFDVVCQFLAFEKKDVERDIRVFSGQCAQYLFISSASAYQKPWTDGVITENTPLNNPFMQYSRNKAACEGALHEAHINGKLPVTVVRPSHTYSERLPSTLIDGNHLAWRIKQGKPIVVHGNGESLWTLTRSEDFANAFVGLCGNASAVGETYHITDSVAYTWNVILQTIAELMGYGIDLCPVSCEALVRYQAEWRGPLLGDKANSVVFDNSKISAAVGGWHCQQSLHDGLSKALQHTQAKLHKGYQPSSTGDALIDRIIAEQIAAKS